MNVAKVEYIYEDENGTEYTAEESTLEEEDLEHHGGADIQEVMIIERHEDNFVHPGTATLIHGPTDERDPDCRRRDTHHCWGIQQSLKLIASITKHKDELANASNRRDIWRKIHRELLEQGLTVTIQECQNKWKNLIRSYKECTKMKNKDNMRFRYYKEMSDYFGGEKFLHMDHDYNKSKLTLMPLLSSGSTGASSSKVVPTVTFPPICFTDRQFMEYTNMKREEYTARQKRHDEEMNLRRQELEVQKKKLEVMKKSAMATLQGTKTVNFGRKRKATNSNNNDSQEQEFYEVVEQDSNSHVEILSNLAF